MKAYREVLRDEPRVTTPVHISGVYHGGIHSEHAAAVWGVRGEFGPSAHSPGTWCFFSQIALSSHRHGVRLC